jgi:hypothetical protein
VLAVVAEPHVVSLPAFMPAVTSPAGVGGLNRLTTWHPRVSRMLSPRCRPRHPDGVPWRCARRTRTGRRCSVGRSSASRVRGRRRRSIGRSGPERSAVAGGVAAVRGVESASSGRLQPVDQPKDRLAGEVRARHAQGFQVIRLKLKGYEKGSPALSPPHTAHSGRRQSLMTRLRLHHAGLYHAAVRRCSFCYR